MMQVYAEEYIHIGRMLQYWMGFNGTGELTVDEYTDYEENLITLAKHCRRVGLSTSEQLVMMELTEILASQGAAATRRHVDCSRTCAEIDRCVRAELKSKFYFHIPSEQARYFTFTDLEKSPAETIMGQELRRFDPVVNKFPSIFTDLEDAGRSYATSSYTASVFHLMRICEWGLVSLASSLGLDSGISSWEKLLTKISAEIGRRDKEKPDGWEDEKRFFSEAATLMQNVKNSWRNSVSHIRKTYDEPRARRIFNTVEALMNHLATRLKETPLPPASLLLDPEAPSQDEIPSK